MTAELYVAITTISTLALAGIALYRGKKLRTLQSTKESRL